MEPEHPLTGSNRRLVGDVPEIINEHMKNDFKRGYGLSDVAKELNRPVVYLRGLQARFELPIIEGEGYSHAYFVFLQQLVFLRILNISEETLRDLWRLEKKLLRLLNIDSTGSKTWFLDACGQKPHHRRRLLLSNCDIGVNLPSQTLQLGLKFSDGLPEFFAGSEMGENAMRVLADYLKIYTRVKKDIQTEAAKVRSAANWAVRSGVVSKGGKC